MPFFVDGAYSSQIVFACQGVAGSPSLNGIWQVGNVKFHLPNFICRGC